MPYVVDLLPELSVVRAVFTGKVLLQDRGAALSALIRLQAESSFRNVLVDIMDASLADASNAETFEYAMRLAREPVTRYVRIAYVGDMSPGASVECLAASRGYFYQRFRSQASALRWLSGHALRSA